MDTFVKPIKKWYKKNKSDTVWWFKDEEVKGTHIFSFDKKKKYNLFLDYPHNLTKEEIAIFDRENPFWANFFKSRKEGA